MAFNAANVVYWSNPICDAWIDITFLSGSHDDLHTIMQIVEKQSFGLAAAANMNAAWTAAASARARNLWANGDHANHA